MSRRTTVALPLRSNGADHDRYRYVFAWTALVLHGATLMNDAFFEQLLHEDEGPQLDFKRDQYPLDTDVHKAELIKDILAFANAWRRECAYIVIGVDQVLGGRSVPVGVWEHLKDHNLQQLVNSKTNRPVSFHYTTHVCDGKSIGILAIPTQRRPIFLTKPFGGLQENVAYVRRGSATDIADPEEIARMGAAEQDSPSIEPTSVSLEWGEPGSRRLLGTKTRVEIDVLRPQLDVGLIPRPSAYALALSPDNPDYPGELIEYVFESRMVRALFLVIHNAAQTPAHGLAVTGAIPRASGLRLRGRPVERPVKSGLKLGSLHFRSPLSEPDPEIDEHDEHWSLIVSFGTLRPGQTIWSTKPIYIGADHPMLCDLELHLMAENLPIPIPRTLSVDIAANMRAMTPSDVLAAEEE